ncbi:FAD binding domain-containing protein [Cellulomonas fengjieae]|uniref:FAD binding domain-containing protein n=1 Tax=Cellulomonas fengjieae TaxID=2819978 RepID=UPI001AB01613|nr:FAD binding domain-containing protein [Cellulomonas fengjieae]MBO3103440.1 FAD binding domain-containing protein [Cellulomonas fengjieae]
MDLTSLDRIRAAHDRTELALGPRSAPLAGGTWLFSEPQPDLEELVDLTTLGWPAVEANADGLSLAATCTIRSLADLPPVPGWHSQHLVQRCARSLVASEKIWDWATVGGNICLALPAGALITLAVALDATAVVWTPDGGERRVAVADLVTGVRITSLRTGEVLRSVAVDREVLAQPAAFRRAALSRHGRSGAIVVGRRDPAGGLVVTLTAGVTRPHRLAFPAPPSAAELRAGIEAVDDWYDDPHGAPAWRRAMTVRLAEQVREELA